MFDLKGVGEIFNVIRGSAVDFETINIEPSPRDYQSIRNIFHGIKPALVILPSGFLAFKSSTGLLPLNLSDSLRTQLNWLLEINGRLIFWQPKIKSVNTTAYATCLVPHPIKIVVDIPKLPFQNEIKGSMSARSATEIRFPMYFNSNTVAELLLNVSHRNSISEVTNFVAKVDKNFEPAALMRKIVTSIMSIRSESIMLIPDISPAVPRAIAPDSLPNQIPIPQPIASELGLKSGQVISALLSRSGESMHLKLNNGQQIVVSGALQQFTGAVTLKVRQAGSKFFFIPQHMGLAGGLNPDPTVSASLLNILARSGSRQMISTFLAPNNIEKELIASGFARDAALLAQQRLNSRNLNAISIARALSFTGLTTEHSLLNGLALNTQSLKPWLRQILRLLPNQSELMIRISESIADLESLQLDVLPQAGTRESGYAALLLFQDQKPVEMTLEKQITTEDDSSTTVWVLNLYSEIEKLGQIWMKTAIRENSLAMTIWADRKTTAELAEESHFELKSSLKDHGLILDSLQIFDRPRPPEDHSKRASNVHMELKA